MPTFGFRLDPRQDESRSGAGHESRSRHGPVRRITGYHNAFDDEEPPDYHDDHPLSDFKLPIPNLPHIDPPKYSCTTFIEGVLEMRLERISPFDSVKDSQWDKVHVRLQGTMLEIHQAKTFGLFTPASKRGNVTGSPGRLLKRYTMQHAEVGVAADFRKTETVCRSPIANLLPESTLRQLMVTEPSQFYIVYNHVSRLRLEGSQILLRFKSSDERSDWMLQLCSAIDIAPPLDIRSEPRYHTLPRRRRRDQFHTTTERVDGHNASLVEEQEQLFRQHYPHLLPSSASNDRGTTAESHTIDRPDSPGPDTNTADEPDPETEDLDLAFMAAGQDNTDQQSDDMPRPPDSPSINQFLPSAHTGIRTIHIRRTRVHATDPSAKWCPAMHIDPTREARYRRRCMPMLVYNSRYATNIVITDGKRMTIDWGSKTLKPCPLPPPVYSASASNDSSDGPIAVVTLRRLLRQVSTADMRTSKEGNESQPSSAGATRSSGDAPDGSGDDQSFASPATSWKGPSTWGRRLRQLTKMREETPAVSDDSATRNVREPPDRMLRGTKSMDVLSNAPRPNERALRRLGI